MKKFYLKLILFVILVFVILIGCASRKEIVQFKNDTLYLKNQVDALRAENQEIKKMIQELNQTIKQQQEEIRLTRADLMVELNALKEQSQFLDNKIEENIQQISRSMLRSSVRPKPVIQKDTINEDSSSSSVLPETKLDAAELYNTAYKDLTRGNYQLALEGFRQFLINFPDHPLAENAQYWIGEAFYAQAQYHIAFEEFKIVVTKYNAGRKVPAALLKMAYCLIKQGKRLEARYYLDQVIRKFPKSEEAQLAKEKLKEISK